MLYNLLPQIEVINQYKLVLIDLTALTVESVPVTVLLLSISILSINDFSNAIKLSLLCF